MICARLERMPIERRGARIDEVDGGCLPTSNRTLSTGGRKIEARRADAVDFGLNRTVGRAPVEADAPGTRSVRCGAVGLGPPTHGRGCTVQWQGSIVHTSNTYVHSAARSHADVVGCDHRRFVRAETRGLEHTWCDYCEMRTTTRSVDAASSSHSGAYEPAVKLFGKRVAARLAQLHTRMLCHWWMSLMSWTCNTTRSTTYRSTSCVFRPPTPVHAK